ncbi:MAG TPA: dihydrolipoamide acetyltransferase family protein [Acidimicrobiales bacterium]|nr:dihydrolipoamide acetyltransferase family protein [Acidimicrobiales bacterium]
MADITMPQLGETVTEGTITRWFKQVGDKVQADEALFEISTDKVDSEVPSPASGTLAEILVEEGGVVEVGAKLGVISDSDSAGGDGDSAGATPASSGAGEPDAPVAPDPTGGGEGKEAEPEEEAAPAEPETQPAAGAEGKESGGSLSSTTTAEGRPTAAPEERTPTKKDGDGSSAAKAGSGASRLLSPVVRRLVAEYDLDPDAIEGSGAGGRITRNDVLAVIDRERSGKGAAGTEQRRPASAPAPAAPAPARAAGTAVAAEGDEVVPFSNIRRRTAEHMVMSKATSAHTLVAIEVDYEGVDKVRLAEKARFKAEEGINLTYLPFVSRAVVDAIREFPHVNASVGDNELVVHRAVHLSIAVDINFEGLMAPVVHGAGAKRLRALARDIADLAQRARSRKLGPDDIAGGTFTITNPGPFGTLLTGAIINQPQVAILSTDGVRKRPVVVELPDGSDAIAIHPVGNLAITFDHRAIDGAYASAFVAKVKQILETRDWAAELA